MQDFLSCSCVAEACPIGIGHVTPPGIICKRRYLMALEALIGAAARTPEEIEIIRKEHGMFLWNENSELLQRLNERVPS